MRLRRGRGDEGPRQLGADRAVRQAVGGRWSHAAAAGVRQTRGRGGRAPPPHQGMVPGAVAEVARSPVRLAAARGKAAREDRDRSGEGGQVAVTGFGQAAFLKTYAAARKKRVWFERLIRYAKRLDASGKPVVRSPRRAGQRRSSIGSALIIR